MIEKECIDANALQNMPLKGIRMTKDKFVMKRATPKNEMKEPWRMVEETFEKI